MSVRIGVAVMAVVFGLYIWLLGGRAIAMIGAGLDTGEPIAVVMGGALIVFPLVGAWALGRELWFGWRETASRGVWRRKAPFPTTRST